MTVPENNSRNTSSDSCSLSNLEPLTQDKIDRYEDKLMHILMELRETEEQYSAGWKKKHYSIIYEKTNLEIWNILIKHLKRQRQIF